MNPYRADCLPVEYLNSTNAVTQSNEPMIVITVRLGLDAEHPFKPTDIAFPKSVAERLVEDLKRSLRDSTMFRPKS